MCLTIITYCFYLAISVAFTVWVCHTLVRNGRVFLIHVFNDNYALADSVNHLLAVGFYLINLGYITMALKTYEQIGTWTTVMEVLSNKIGCVLFVLGVMHFFNLGVFACMNKPSPVKDVQGAHLDQEHLIYGTSHDPLKLKS